MPEQKDDQRIVSMFKERYDQKRPRTDTLTAEEEAEIQEFVDKALPADADEILAFLDYINELNVKKEGDSNS